MKLDGFSTLLNRLRGRPTPISLPLLNPATPPSLLDSEDGYNFVSARGRVFAVPQSLGPVDVGADDISDLPGVIVGDVLPHVRMLAVKRLVGGAPRVPVASMLSSPANVAFYGANHPALAPLFSPRYDDGIDVIDIPGEPELSHVTLGRLDYALRTLRSRLATEGISDTDIEAFIASRDYLTQLMACCRGGIHFFQGAPLTLGVNPWMIQVENASSLFLPFVTDDDSGQFDRTRSPIYRIIRNLLRSDECVGIVTNIRATERDLPLLFESPSLAEKTYYLPFFLEPPAQVQKRPRSFLFTTSFHQHEQSFYSRGGIDAALIFAEISKCYPDAQLVMRCTPPAGLPETVRSILEAPNVQIIDEPISDEEMHGLFARSQFYLLPAASLHSMSTLQAMAHGCVCVLADSWASDEYLHHGVDGLRIAGREGKHWRYRAEEGYLESNYAGLERPDLAFVHRAVEAVSLVMSNADEVRRISDAARAAATKSNSAEAGRKAFARILRDIQLRSARDLGW